MRVVAFYHEGDIPPYLKLMVMSVQKHIKLPLIQLTNLETAAVDGVDGVVRYDIHESQARNRLYALSQYDAELISLDTDVIVRRDVQEIFDHEFDVALTPRLTKDPDSIDLYNIGFMASRSRQFFADAYEWARKRGDDFNAQQEAINVTAHSGLYKVHQLDLAVYNCTPPADSSRAAVLHFKGSHKKKMLSCVF